MAHCMYHHPYVLVIHVLIVLLLLFLSLVLVVHLLRFAASLGALGLTLAVVKCPQTVAACDCTASTYYATNGSTVNISQVLASIGPAII